MIIEYSTLKLNYKYGNGLIKENAESEIRSHIQNLSLLIIQLQKYDNNLAAPFIKTRTKLYNIISQKVELSIVK